MVKIRINQSKSTKNELETALKLQPAQRSQYLSAVWQNNYIRTKYNYLFEIPLTVDASIELDVLRQKLFNSIPKEEFIEELKKTIYWEKFKHFKVKNI
ncbi:MAG: hypothetical protein GAK29_00259 [Acinetobacter bereziniae]|uniref:Uncharacterized protein n=1 Tax=Acinetobacter bereziniae TaxID=106648 RepID=A0A833PJB5_ACIBZ|nr:MAG: hypothetical protein GAK29_00259 [Acinetobacter bereziniae]